MALALAACSATANLVVEPDALEFDEGAYLSERVTFASDEKGELCLTNWKALVDAQGNDRLRIWPEVFNSSSPCVDENYSITETFWSPSRGHYTKTAEWTWNAGTHRWEFPADVSISTEDDNILGGGETRRTVSVTLKETATGGLVTYSRSLYMTKKDDERVNFRARLNKRSGWIRIHANRPVADYTRGSGDSACTPDPAEPMTGALCVRIFFDGPAWGDVNTRLIGKLITQQELADSHADRYWLRLFNIHPSLYDCSYGYLTGQVSAFPLDPELRHGYVKVRSNHLQFCARN